jgi:hypothetical protein
MKEPILTPKEANEKNLTMDAFDVHCLKSSRDLQVKMLRKMERRIFTVSIWTEFSEGNTTWYWIGLKIKGCAEGLRQYNDGYLQGLVDAVRIMLKI